MHIQTNDITTRLLAQENLLIQRAAVSTASFDTVNRVLTLPQWQNMTPEIEEMLKAHEVAHALYTDHQIFEQKKEAEGKKGLSHGYLNVLEDVRIEKLMKRKYPGLRSVFNKGYTQLNERDFFDLTKHDVSKLLLIDRINLYYKAGYACGVKFTPAEKYLVDQVARLETIEDVVVLARKIYDFTKKNQEEQRQQLLDSEEFKKMIDEKNEEFEPDPFEEMEDMLDDEEDRHEYYHDEDEDEDNIDENDEEHGQTSRGSASEYEGTDPFLDNNHDPVTVKAFEDKLAEAADVNTEYTYIEMIRMSEQENEIIIPYKKVLSDNYNSVENIKTKIDNGIILEYYAERYLTAAKNLNKDYDQFMSETQRVVAYLVKEFEMRKAATDYKRIQISKTGILDSRKLAQYKIREDLFKSISMTKDGKKHGLLFVLDWSGSMSDYLTDTVKQLISLVMFCHRIKIPFQVFAFTDAKFNETGMTSEQLREKRKQLDLQLINQAKNTIGISSNFHMLELFSHKMTNSDFYKMCKTMFAMSYGFVEEDYRLGGTPLNEALTFLYDYSDKFVRTNQVEKFTLIKLTDGDGGGVYNYNQQLDQSKISKYNELELKNGYTCSSMHYDMEWRGSGKVRQVRFLRCPVTKKVYEINRNTQWGNLLTQLIKDRYNCGTIGFHVTDKRAREINYAINTYGIKTDDQIIYESRRDMIKEGFSALRVYGHDELFLLNSSHKVNQDELSDDMTKMTAAAIAKQFTKHLSAKKTSRILLNRFVGVVA